MSAEPEQPSLHQAVLTDDESPQMTDREREAMRNVMGFLTKDAPVFTVHPTIDPKYPNIETA